MYGAVPASRPPAAPPYRRGMTEGTFLRLLNEQIGHEFHASQQYIAIAVYFDREALPQLAAHFYAQSVEERNHAMMLVQYLLDADARIEIPGTGEVVTSFDAYSEPVALALAQERQVTEQIKALVRAAREEGDLLGEQFLQWFLKEQVEEVATVSTLLRVMEHAGDTILQVEEYLSRQPGGAGGPDPTAPSAAGGAL